MMELVLAVPDHYILSSPERILICVEDELAKEQPVLGNSARERLHIFFQQMQVCSHPDMHMQTPEGTILEGAETDHQDGCGQHRALPIASRSRPTFNNAMTAQNSGDDLHTVVMCHMRCGRIDVRTVEYTLEWYAIGVAVVDDIEGSTGWLPGQLRVAFQRAGNSEAIEALSLEERADVVIKCNAAQNIACDRIRATIRVEGYEASFMQALPSPYCCMNDELMKAATDSALTQVYSDLPFPGATRRERMVGFIESVWQRNHAPHVGSRHLGSIFPISLDGIGSHVIGETGNMAPAPFTFSIDHPNDEMTVLPAIGDYTTSVSEPSAADVAGLNFTISLPLQSNDSGMTEDPDLWDF
jgi:hypothetical protein